MERREFISKIVSAGVCVAIVPTVLISSTPEAGKNFSQFTLRFPDKYFDKNNVIVGPNGIPIHIKTGPKYTGEDYWQYSYECQIMTADPNLSIPGDYLEGDVEFKKDWSLVEKTLEKKCIKNTYYG